MVQRLTLMAEALLLSLSLQGTKTWKFYMAGKFLSAPRDSVIVADMSNKYMTKKKSDAITITVTTTVDRSGIYHLLLNNNPQVHTDTSDHAVQWMHYTQVVDTTPWPVIWFLASSFYRPL
jgi:hypothetical protein